MLLANDEQVYAFTRRLDDVELLVLGNFSGAAVTVDLPDAMEWVQTEVAIGNYPTPPSPPATLWLQPWEARVHRRRHAAADAPPSLPTA
jgi:oligo-1,6-glucosidase